MTMISVSRRTAIAAVSALLLAACGPKEGAGNGQVAAVSKDDHVKGAADAPVTLIEYASPTCPACKYFHDSILPELEEKYISTGKVKLVYREFPLHGDVDVASYVLALCAGEDKYFDVLDDLFANQNGILDAARSGVLAGTLQSIGKRHGIETKAQFDACMSNRDYRLVLADKYQTGTEKWGVNSTPTFILNGKVSQFEGDFRTTDGISKQIDALLGVEAAPAPAETDAETPADTSVEAEADTGAPE